MPRNDGRHNSSALSSPPTAAGRLSFSFALFQRTPIAAAASAYPASRNAAAAATTCSNRGEKDRWRTAAAAAAALPSLRACRVFFFPPDHDRDGGDDDALAALPGPARNVRSVYTLLHTYKIHYTRCITASSANDGSVMIIITIL